jgi:long-chain acyl-CoA synthetase
MRGYWDNAEASAKTLDKDGWLRSGDRARIDERGHVYIVGRIKDIIVLSSGEKVSPGDMEAAMLEEPLIEQTLIIGEGKPYLSALAVVNQKRFSDWAKERGIEGDPGQNLSDARVTKAVLDTLAKRLRAFPGYAKLRRIALLAEPWTVENGMLTPTLKPRRVEILKKYADIIQDLYRGHGV